MADKENVELNEIPIMVSNFFLISILGRTTSFNDEEEGEEEYEEKLVMACIRKAYDDMMSAGRFFVKNKNGKPGTAKKENCDNVYEIMKKEKFLFSRELIKKTADKLFGNDCEKLINGKNYAIPFGLAQKVINMTYKYLYCAKCVLGDKWENYKNISEIAFEKCDCPVDSIIIKAAGNENLMKKDTKLVWSKMTVKEYNDFQNEIDKWGNNGEYYSKIAEKMGCSKRLLFDFLRWKDN